MNVVTGSRGTDLEHFRVQRDKVMSVPEAPAAGAPSVQNAIVPYAGLVGIII